MKKYAADSSQWKSMLQIIAKKKCISNTWYCSLIQSVTLIGCISFWESGVSMTTDTREISSGKWYSRASWPLRNDPQFINLFTITVTPQSVLWKYSQWKGMLQIIAKKKCIFNTWYCNLIQSVTLIGCISFWESGVSMTTDTREISSGKWYSRASWRNQVTEVVSLQGSWRRIYKKNIIAIYRYDFWGSYCFGCKQ